VADQPWRTRGYGEGGRRVPATAAVGADASGRGARRVRYGSCGTG
jgi:hypothetical protein